MCGKLQGCTGDEIGGIDVLAKNVDIQCLLSATSVVREKKNWGAHSFLGCMRQRRKGERFSIGSCMSAKGLGRLLGRVISEREGRSEVKITRRQILCVEGTTGVQRGPLYLSRHYAFLHGRTNSGGEGQVSRSQAGSGKSSVQVLSPHVAPRGSLTGSEHLSRGEA